MIPCQIRIKHFITSSVLQKTSLAQLPNFHASIASIGCFVLSTDFEIPGHKIILKQS